MTQEWFPIGRNNWARVSVAEESFRFEVNTKAENLYKDFDEAANVAAKLLYEDWGNKPLYLAFSGGTDGELVARILLQNKIPFTPIILKISTFNDIESRYAHDWCSRNNVTPLVLTMTVNEYVSGMKDNLKKLLFLRNIYQTPLLTIIDHVEKLGGHCIHASGDNWLDDTVKQFYSNSMEFVTDILYPGRHPTGFFMYTPELALSYVYQYDHTIDNQYNKLSFYKINPRPKIDYYPLMAMNPEINDLYNKIYGMFEHGRHGNIQSNNFWWGTKQETIDTLFSENKSVK